MHHQHACVESATETDRDPRAELEVTLWNEPEEGALNITGEPSGSTNQSFTGPARRESRSSPMVTSADCPHHEIGWGNACSVKGFTKAPVRQLRGVGSALPTRMGGGIPSGWAEQRHGRRF